MGNRAAGLPHLEEDEEKDRHYRELEDDEAHEDLRVRPAEVLLAVVVQREAHLANHAVVANLEPEPLRHAEKDELPEPAAAVDEDNRRKEEDEERIARHHRRSRDEDAEEAAPRVAHQYLRRLGVVPEVARERTRNDHHHDRPARGLGVDGNEEVVRDRTIADDDVQREREHRERYRRERPGESVDSVGAVRRVHREPEQERRKRNVGPAGDQPDALHERKPCYHLEPVRRVLGVSAEDEERDRHGDDEVQETLLELPPRNGRAVVEVAEQHREVQREDGHEVPERERREEHDHRERDERHDEPRAGGLALSPRGEAEEASRRGRQ